ncbi:dehydrogenase/reductase SDR family member 7-like [Sycon ciliatum]|uniref:dehydrogenase/reductase SDR family member 7-like n=1 Tax=Sycon ciliatum TaxID=27933 RepID=UPI0020AAE627|eukprot:scpid66619/ scgid7345/ Dehydrogenase/reductase SDR family member 7; Retinal short-chain dehydrogenase/reductase 4
MFMFLIQLLGLAVFLASIAVVVLLVFSDGDLVLMRKKLRREYFRDRVVWVTGASSGIGEAIARSLSRIGAKVILSSRTESKLEAVRQSLDHPDNAKVLVMDVANTDGMEKYVSEAIGLFGHVDMLVNNAGVAQRGLYSQFTLDTQRRLFEVDFFGQITLTKALLPHFVQRGGGHIANVSSIAGKVGSAGRTIYCGAKFALIGYMDALRMELQGLEANVAVTNICPGPVATNVDSNALNGDGTRHGQADKLIQGGMKPERCAELSLVAMSNRLPEAWICPQPLLMAGYLSQYCPHICFKLAKKVAPRMVKEVQQATEGSKKDS